MIPHFIDCFNKGVINALRCKSQLSYTLKNPVIKLPAGKKTQFRSNARYIFSCSNCGWHKETKDWEQLVDLEKLKVID